jgi:hypothetical protein
MFPHQNCCTKTYLWFINIYVFPGFITSMYSIIFSICCLNQVTYMLLQQFFCKIYIVNVHRKYSFSLLSLLIPLMTMLTLNISKFLILPDLSGHHLLSHLLYWHFVCGHMFLILASMWPLHPCMYWWLHILVPFPYLACSVFKSSASEISHSLELTYKSVRCCLYTDTEALSFP